MGFNKDQQLAIDATSLEDILIAAGAGSGKTSTLSEHTYTLIAGKDGKGGEILPSELLVLTFTNNAAHEMKERIIARFKNNNPDLADQMQSAHIQTFDSFSQYLVTTYAGRLGVSSSITVADEMLIKAKTQEILDQIFDEYYADPQKREKLLKTLVKFNTKDDKNTKAVILKIYRELEKILPAKRADFIKNYDARYYSDEALHRYIDEAVAQAKRWIYIKMHVSFFIATYYDTIFALDYSPSAVAKLFKSSALFDMDCRLIRFDEDTVLNPLADALNDLLALEGIEFLKALKAFSFTNKHLLDAKFTKKAFPGYETEQLIRWKKIFDPMQKLFATKKATLTEYLDLPDTEEGLKEEAFQFRSDVHLMLDIVEELDARLFDYKKSTNAFTFADIATLALRPVTEPEFEDIAKELRKRFRYIMVDEYQDTNDFQEAFLNSLIAPDENGNRAHLFCVGDAKQSIYAFRNSNVALFRKRQADYEAGQGKVITMNLNYRSGKQLIQEINAIFSCYMKLDHGAIDYLDTDPVTGRKKEQLTYDDDRDIYKDPLASFGIYRVTSPNESNQRMAPTEWETEAMIALIKQYVAEGHLVYDRGNPVNKIRPCQYRDFAILCRTKREFRNIQKAFNEAGVPLNVSVANSLREIDAVLLIQSLMNLIAWKMYGAPANVKHLYASIARSYAYDYGDAKIYEHISIKDDKQFLESIASDPIMVTLEEFAKSHKDASFQHIFLDMLHSFHVVDRLYVLGDIDDNFAKIESLYSMVLGHEKAGEGLAAFNEFFKSARKFDLDISAETEIEVENSVDLMTIHASKGLERKIVLMPVSMNKYPKVPERLDMRFSMDYGILLPNYVPKGSIGDTLADVSQGYVHNLPFKLYSKNKQEDQDEVDEHVRLFYVALTRAENEIHIVGQPEEAYENLYGMLDYMPHFEQFDPDLIKRKLQEGVITKADVDSYYQFAKEHQEAKAVLSPSDFENEYAYDTYIELAHEHLEEIGNDKLKERFDELREKLYVGFLAKLQENRKNPAYFIPLFGYWTTSDKNVSSIEEIYERYKEGFSEEEISEEYGTLEVFNQDFLAFIDAVCDENLDHFNITLTGDESKEDPVAMRHKKMTDILLNTFAYVFEDCSIVSTMSYRSEDYPDNRIYIDLAKQQEQVEKEVYLPHVQEDINNEAIDMPVREKKRASKGEIKASDADTPVQTILDEGVRLHRYMENMDFLHPSVDDIPSPDKEMIANVLELDLFKNINENTKVLPEYGYFDEDYRTSGFIDLLLVEDGIYTIVDYKRSNIYDAHYDEQLRTYARNVMHLFHVSKEQIRMILVSLSTSMTREVFFPDDPQAKFQ